MYKRIAAIVFVVAASMAAGSAFAVSLLTESVAITVPEPISVDVPVKDFSVFPGATHVWTVNVTNTAPNTVDVQFLLGEVLNSAGQPASGFTLAGATGVPMTIPAGATETIEVGFTADNGIPADVYSVSVGITRP